MLRNFEEVILLLNFFDESGFIKKQYNLISFFFYEIRKNKRKSSLMNYIYFDKT